MMDVHKRALSEVRTKWNEETTSGCEIKADENDASMKQLHSRKAVTLLKYLSPASVARNCRVRISDYVRSMNEETNRDLIIVHFLRHLWCSWNVYTIILQQKRSEQTESLWELLHNPQSLEPQSLIILRRTVNKRRQSDDDTIISSFIFALSVDIYHSHCFIHALLLMLACHTLVSISLSQAYNGMIKKLV